MNQLIQIISIAIILHLLGLVIDPRWCWLILLLFGIIYRQSGRASFWVGFAGVAIAWLGYALWLDIFNQHILSSRIAVLIGEVPAWILPLITAMIGGIGGGLSTWLGHNIRSLFPSE